VVVLAQAAGTPAGGPVRCLLLRDNVTRYHLKIVTGRGANGVLGRRATNARMWLGRPAHVARCLELFDTWPRHACRLDRPVRPCFPWPRDGDASVVTALARLEIYVCWEGAGSWAAARMLDCRGTIIRGGTGELHDCYGSDATIDYQSEHAAESDSDKSVENDSVNDFMQVECGQSAKGGAGA
jgi:hypothetical protein